MTFETIDLMTDARGVAAVTLRRPDKHNTMNAQMIAELTIAAKMIAGDQTIRAVVLSGEGPSFCAGGDLAWMRDQTKKSRIEKMKGASALAAMLGLWNVLPTPVIARVHGAVYGGGLGLIAVCDIVIAEENTRYAFTETRLGLIPATIGPFVIRRLGEAFARQVFFTARPFDTAFLMRAGLIARSCIAADLDAAIEDEIEAIFCCAPGAVAAAKALCRSLSGTDPLDASDMSANALADCWETEETEEGIACFFAKETPSWRRADTD